MKIAILLFPDFTALDVVGPYEILVHAPGVEVVFVAKNKGLINGEVDVFQLMANHSFSEIDACDILIIPGGPGDAEAATDIATLDWVRKIHQTTTYTTSICTGALVLAAAGLLEGKDATTHWAAKETLNRLGAHYQPERWVQQGKIITAAGVSAGIDMALYLLADLMGNDTAKMVQLGTEYDPQPPFDSGSVAKAEPHIHGVLSTSFAKTFGVRHKKIVKYNGI